MQVVRQSSTRSAGSTASREVEAVLGLAGGAQVRGWLQFPAAWRVFDLINNVREPTLTLSVGPLESGAGSLTVTRANIAWIGSLHEDPPGTGDNDSRGAQAEHAVLVHVGPFELRGTITTHDGVQWSNFLVGRAGPPAEFFVLGDAQLAGSAALPTSTIGVNVGLVSALQSLG